MRGGLLCSGLRRDGGAPHPALCLRVDTGSLSYICLIHSSLINMEGGGRKTDRHREERGRERRRERERCCHEHREERERRGGRREESRQDP